jgi:hypothetical protein
VRASKHPLEPAWRREPIGDEHVFFYAKTILERNMADGGSGGIGVLGVLIGAIIVVVVGFGALYATGKIGSGGGSSVKIEVPKTTGSGGK